MSYGLARARYTSDATETVSPARLLTMLYDRLVADLLQAEGAMTRRDPSVTGERLGSAQSILLELHATLDIESWEGGEALDQLYVWIIAELMRARMSGQPQRVADCRALIEPLRDAWHLAASGLPPMPVSTPAGSGDTPAPAAVGVVK